MALTFQTSIEALIIGSNIARADRTLATAVERLSSGLRINRAGDDVAGSAQAASLDARSRSFGAALQNANEALSLVQTGSDALDVVADILADMRAKAVTASGGGINQATRDALNADFQALRAQIDGIANTTVYNSKPLLDGVYQYTFQIGPDPTSSTMTLDTLDTNSNVIGLSAAKTLDLHDISSIANANAAILSVDQAVIDITAANGRFGTAEVRLGFAIDFNTAMRDNLSAARSKIVDADIAMETAIKTAAEVRLLANASLLAVTNKLQSDLMILLL